MEKANGLSANGISFKDILEGRQKAHWLDFSRSIAQLLGNKELLNMTSGIGKLDKFLFRMIGWHIGGVYFDGIMRTEHSSRVKATQYPVQTGVLMAEHAIIEPISLTIEIMTSDAHNSAIIPNTDFLDTIYNAYKVVRPYISSAMPKSYVVKGEGRSAAAWQLLKAMQMARIPITVETRLGTYHNMLIEELSAPDDIKTLHALRCTVRLKEIVVASVAEVKVAARPSATKQANGGQVAAKVKDKG